MRTNVLPPEVDVTSRRPRRRDLFSFFAGLAAAVPSALALRRGGRASAAAAPATPEAPATSGCCARAAGTRSRQNRTWV